jgi:hypothetical protein
MHSWIRITLIAVLIPLALAACQRDDAEARSATPAADGVAQGAANVVLVTGRDFEYDAPLEIAPGLTTFRFIDEGPEPHHLTLMRLEGGHTMDDFMAALRDRRPLDGIATALGGPNAPGPGGESNATMHMEPGEYVMACFIPSPDGVPHIAKGMVRPLTVRGDAVPAADEEVDVDITFLDYAFNLPEEVRPGRRTIRVTTHESASEPHEVLLVRLAEGRTVEDMNDWIHTFEGPPPGEFLGGITALDPGESATFTADFTPGEYALLCPIPSAHDGEPHTYKGMMRQFTVR